MKSCLRLLVLSSLLLASGCYECVTLLSVNRDGTGKIIVQQAFSPQLTAMVNDLEQAQVGEEELETRFRAALERRAEHLGDGVEVLDIRRHENERGWQGFRTIYVFKDVRRLRLQPGAVELPEGTASVEAINTATPTYGFEFEAGEQSVLSIIPAPSAVAHGAAGQDDAAEPPPQHAPAANMLEPMVRGMRHRFVVHVKGRITETNAKYTSPDRHGILTILDMRYDEIIKMPEAVEELVQARHNPTALTRLAAMAPPGVKLEDPKKTITVRFE